MSLYTRLQSTASRLITSKGNAEGLLIRRTPGAYDPALGAPASPVETSYPVKAFVDASSLRTLGYRYGEALVKSGDLEATVAASGLPITPEPGDILQVTNAVDKGITGVTLKVVANQSTPSLADAVIHTMLVRQ